jgi:hypothetical protein
MKSPVSSDAPPEHRSELWYQDPTRIQHHFYGVFEGGGAKGIAYAGALLAMRERQCWFLAVAGSSAGAITAALVAAGLEPEEIATATEDGINTVRCGFWSGIANLRSGGGFFDSTRLRDWLDAIFRNRVGLRIGKPPDAPVTFRELFDATHIELNIVAADISMRRQLVLSHLSASECLIADAVVASCSIPFAFPSRVLAVPERQSGNQVLHHTIVDGGVWANFPIFVFEDAEFRKFDQRAEEIDRKKIIGFLLKTKSREEAEKTEFPRGDDVVFVRQISDRDFKAREWFPNQGSSCKTARPFWSAFASWFLLPIELLGRFHNSSVQRGLDAGRWPLPRVGWARRLVIAGDGFLTAIGVPGGGLISLFIGPLLVTMILGVGAWTVCAYITTGAFRPLDSLNWYDVESYTKLLFRGIVTLGVYSAAVLTVLVGVLGILATMLLLRPARRVLYGLVTTYVAGPGAPVWYYNRGDIVALPIPPDLWTLQFDISRDIQQQVIDDARNATLKRLDAMLEREIATELPHTT